MNDPEIVVGSWVGTRKSCVMDYFQINRIERLKTAIKFFPHKLDCFTKQKNGDN